MDVSSVFNKYKVFAPNNEVTADPEQDEIDAEIARHELCILVLKDRRNKRAPIHRLPAEILSSIFIWYRDMCSGYAYWPLWTRVSHVCRHWRDVALDSPRLWSHIVSWDSPEWTHECLLRSKNAPLRITLDDAYPAFEETMLPFVERASAHMSRITVLDAETYAGGRTRALLDALVATPAPNLKCLNVYIRGDRVFEVPGGTALPTSFCDSLIQLQHLDLSGSSVPWSSPIFHSLTVLKLSLIPSHLRLSMTQVLLLLGGASSIQILELGRHSLAPAAASNILVTHVVALPSLTSLYLSADVHTCGALLAHHLVLPSSLALKLEWMCTPDLHCPTHTIADGTSMSAIKPILKLKAHDIVCEGVRRLRISAVPADWSKMKVCVKGWQTSELNVDAWGPQGPPAIDLSPVCSQHSHGILPPDGITGLIVDICEALPLAQLEILDIEGIELMTEEAWLKVFGGCTSLRHMTVTPSSRTYDPLNGLENAFGRSTETSSHPGGLERDVSGKFLPALKTLEVHAACLGDPRYPEVMEAFYACFAARCASGFGLQKLIVHASNDAETDNLTKRLREIVAEVEWSSRSSAPLHWRGF
ncbi:hypothetical protein PLICRDRAFT_177530 [Plicaturopsis crispa FD-325 SS-3]|nr:hypothetical protein PLICRDRAFT_177530 [Plicaturopsis crispa FD-325 SS-3]